MSRWTRVTLVIVAVFAVGAGIFATVTYWQETHHNDSCSVYGNALTAALADPGGGKPDQQISDLLTAQDRHDILASDRNYTQEVNQAGSDPSQIDAVNRKWDQFATSFKAQALAVRGC